MLFCLASVVSALMTCPPTLAQAQPLPTLCESGETTIFACGIGAKSVSMCQSVLPADGRVALRYRFGTPGRTPELIYPSRPQAAKDAFSFTTIRGPLWVISFDNQGASYDVISALQADTLPQYNFTGIGVTIKEGRTQLRPCNPGSVVMDMRQLNDDFFPQYAPSLPPPDKSTFRMVSKSIPHGDNWVSTIEYPIISDPRVDREIEAFIKDCYADDSGPDGNCSQTVAANLIRNQFLVLTFESFSYEQGAPHGQVELSFKIFRREGNEWRALEKNSFISEDPRCQRRYAALTNRHLFPELTEKGAAQWQFGDLFQAAEQLPTADGLLFFYEPYALGGYIPPQPFLVDYKSLGSCFTGGRVPGQ
jgi:hypothetical protein